MEVFTMDGTGFLKTVSFGGFDKKDVLAYVDELNTKIYTLEAELDEKKALLESSGGTDGETASKYEELLAADKNKITELQTNNGSLKLQIKSVEDEIAIKNNEIEELKKRTSELEDQLQEAKNKIASGTGVVDHSAVDLSNVFIEAQKTANTIVSQAKENAKKMDEDAKKLANQVVDDANSKASTIVKNADDKANRILTDAEDKSSEMRAAAEAIKTSVSADINDIQSNIAKLKQVLEMFSSESLDTLDKAANLIDSTQGSIRKGGVPSTTAGNSSKSMSNPKPAVAAPKPAPAPAPAPKQAVATQTAKAAPKLSNFGFDMSEIENMAKAIEAEASKAPSSDYSEETGYDDELTPGHIKLSDMM